MIALLTTCGCREVFDDRQLGVQTDVRGGHHAVNLAHRRRPNEHDLRFDPSLPEMLDVVDARFAERRDAGGEELASYLGGSKRRLSHSADLNPPLGEPADEDLCVVPDEVDADLQPRQAHVATGMAEGVSSGKADSTLLTSNSTGRVSASVAGMSSSSW